MTPDFNDEKNGIAVFLSCDERFFPYAITTIASLMENANPETQYTISVVTVDVGRAMMETASQWFSQYKKGSLRFIDFYRKVGTIDPKNFHVTEQFPLAACVRLYAPDLFPDCSRIIYLDSDVIALADLSELYNVDLGDCLLGAVRDICQEHYIWRGPNARYYAALGMEEGGEYFNSGVMIMDLEKMRREGTQEALLAAARKATESVVKPPLLDQDMLNSVCKNRVHFLDAAWNVHEWTGDPTEKSSLFRSMPEAIKAQCRETCRAPRILHFTGTKPWCGDYMGSSDECYWRYLALTPFYEQVLDAFRKSTTFIPMLGMSGRCAFHILRCWFGSLVATGEKKERNKNRLHSYRWRLNRCIGLMKKSRF